VGHNSEDKKKQQQLEANSAADRALFLTSFNKANEPTPLQKAWEDSQLKFMNWENSTGEYAGKPLDVMEAPGMGVGLSQYRRAAAGQQGERRGEGLITMGLNASDPGLAAKLAEQAKARREQEAAGALEEDIAHRSAEAHGSVLPLSQLNTSRALSTADMAGNQAGQSQSLWAQFRRRPGFLGQIGDAFAGSFGTGLGQWASGQSSGGGGSAASFA
jgi:hypothetical protein